MGRATESEIIAEMMRMGWSDFREAAIDAWTSFGGSWPDDLDALRLPVRWRSVSITRMTDAPDAIAPHVVAMLTRERGYQHGTPATRITATLEGTSVQEVLETWKD